MEANYNAAEDDRKPLIELSHISKTYVNAAGSFTALKDINLNFYESEFVGVIGKSGSGKSTLVNMITGIDRPTGGKVLVGGLDIHAMKESDQARWRGLNLGVVFQFFQLLPMLTLLENVLLPMDFCNKYEPDSRVERGMELLALVGLEKEAHKLPGSVSGGQQQSAAIARAMANDPPIIVADEPTGNLDAKTADSVYEKFDSLTGEGRTIIMITHDPEIESRLSRTVLISDGEVIDPVLAHTLSWLPHPVLRELGPSLERRSVSGGEPLDMTGVLSNQLVFIEHGQVSLSARGPSNHKKVTLLFPGDYFSGSGILNDATLQDITVRPQNNALNIATLPWNRVTEALSGQSDLIEKMRSQLHGKMSGKEINDKQEEGMIQ